MLSTIAGLPGKSFDWMVKVNNSWMFPPHCAEELPNFNCMSTSIKPVLPGCLPACVNPGMYMVPAYMMMPRVVLPTVQSMKEQQSNGAQGLPQSLSAPIQNLLPSVNPLLRENLSVFSYGFPREATANAIPGCQRKFDIFDQSGDETRLIYSSFFPTAVKPTVPARKPISGSFMRYEEHAAKMDQINQTVLNLQEVSDENHLSGEESEMHEDTEEINALLYSDEDGDYDDCGDDDETRSTGHSPTLIRSCRMRGQVEEITEEVVDSDCQNKRQKLLDGGYKGSSPLDTASSIRMAEVHGYDDDAESSYVIGQNQEEEMVAIFCNKQLKKDKVRATLKILESIIPGAKEKDPLLVLDIAIDYLKSLKLKAKTQGLNY